MTYKHALVTGAAGFLGSHVTRALLEKGLQVVALDDLSGGSKENVPAGAEFKCGSILDYPLLQRLFEEHQFECVFHLAAYAAEGLSPFIRRFNYENNLLGSINLINLAVRAEIRKFVFTSSIAVYGSGRLPMTEELLPEPEDPYGISKYAVELDLTCANELFGLPYTIFRPHNVFGEFQNIGDRYRNVIGIFMNQLMQGKSLTVFGDGAQTRAFSHVDDVVLPMILCLNRPETNGEIFNVGADQPYSVNHLAKVIMNVLGKTTNIDYLPDRHEVRHAYADHAKIRKFFPELPEPISLEAGIQRMADWAKTHGPRKTKLFMDIEITKKIPEFWKMELDRKDMR